MPAKRSYRKRSYRKRSYKKRSTRARALKPCKSHETRNAKTHRCRRKIGSTKNIKGRTMVWKEYAKGKRGWRVKSHVRRSAKPKRRVVRRKRSVRRRRKVSGKRRLSTYNKFVKAYFAKHKASGRGGAKANMRAAAKAWRAKKRS